MPPQSALLFMLLELRARVCDRNDHPYYLKIDQEKAG